MRMAPGSRAECAAAIPGGDSAAAAGGEVEARSAASADSAAADGSAAGGRERCEAAAAMSEAGSAVEHSERGALRPRSALSEEVGDPGPLILGLWSASVIGESEAMFEREDEVVAAAAEAAGCRLGGVSAATGCCRLKG